MPGQRFFVFESKAGFLMKDRTGSNPLDHELVTSAPVEEGPYGPVSGEDGVPLSPAASKGCESDPIGEEEINAAGISIRSSTRRDERFVSRG